MGNIYSHRPGRFYIQLPGKVRIFVNKNHEPFYSRKQAQKCLGLIESEIENGSFDADFYSTKRKSIRSFEVYALQWLNDQEIRFAKGEISPITITERRRWVDKIWIPALGKLDMRAIKGRNLKDLYLSINRHPKTIYNIFAGLHRLFRDAMDDEIIVKIPHFPVEFKRSSLPDPKWQWADEATQDAIFAELSDEVFYFCYFLATHACRPGEARALMYSDINLKTQQVTFQRAFSGEVLRNFTKTKDTRSVPLDASWVELFKKRPRVIGSQFVFTHEGKPLTERWARNKWTKAAKRAGYPGLTLYQGTRHSFASQALNRGVSLSLISRFLGHSTEEQTRRIYAHLLTDSLRQVQRQTKGAIHEISQKIHRD